MKKILFIIYNLGGGGAEKVLINILNNLDYGRFKVDLLLINEEGVYLKKVNSNVKIKSILSNKHLDNFLNKIYRYSTYKLYEKKPEICAKLFIGKKYDVEIAFLEGPSTELLSKSPNKSSKKVAWVHTNLIKHRTMSFEKEKEVYGFIDEIVCVSQQSKKNFIKLYPEYFKKVQVIYNLIEKDEILSLSNEETDLIINKNTIVAVGRLIKEKRFDILIKAQKLLKDDGIESRLVILGEGNLRLELEELVMNLNLEDSVFFLGFTNNPYPYIKKADIFAMSSDFEGLPLVITEALTLGKAIVSTDCTGPTELLSNGEFGVIVERGNETALKGKIKELLLNKELRENYEKRALYRSEILDREQVMESIYKIIN